MDEKIGVQVNLYPYLFHNLFSDWQRLVTKSNI